VYLGRHKLRVGTLASVQLPLGINHLGAATGLRLPARVIMDRRTPEALARHLADVLADGASPEGSSAMLGDLYAQARENGTAPEFMERLAAAAREREVFTMPVANDVPESVRLSEGRDGAALLCFPTVLATSGPHQYARFAAPFVEERDVFALSLPGFRDGERLPASLEAIAEASAEAVRRRADGDPFVLVGYSSGGVIAHETVRLLEESGVFPDAVVLLDTYVPGDPALAGAGPALMDGMARRLTEFGPVEDARLTAMSGYLRLIEDWQPAPVKAPVLLVRPLEPVPGMPVTEGAGEDSGWASSWQHAHGLAAVPGDHFSMIEEHAADTARTVGAWLSSLKTRERA
ncbi:alpha/beta fold hydrolase, partial [Streptomyces sp. AP-93]|uniref:alpha/beta fold hydrolase n=1 Tax=Streptomyces sp. AP-93 TaxID=2929048 RepID=UPI001FAEBD81